MPVTAKLTKSTNKNKKYMVAVTDGKRKKTIHFGAAGMSDYTIHKDSDRKDRYIARHSKHEKFNDPWTAGFWALHILWNQPSIAESVSDTSKKYNIEIKHS